MLGETRTEVGRPWAQPAAGAPKTLIFQNREHHRTPRRKKELALSIQNPPELEWGWSTGSPRAVPSLTEGHRGSREAQDLLRASWKPDLQTPDI